MSAWSTAGLKFDSKGSKSIADSCRHVRNSLDGPRVCEDVENTMLFLVEFPSNDPALSAAHCDLSKPGKQTNVLVAFDF